MRAVALAAVALGYVTPATSAASWQDAAIERAMLELLSAKDDPAFLFDGPELTAVQGRDGRLHGVCTGIFDVVIETEDGDTSAVPCVNDTWQATLRGGERLKRVSQITRQGAIAVRRIVADTVLPQSTAKQPLRETLATMRAGENVLLLPEEIASGTVLIPASLGGTPSQPTVLDGGKAVVFTDGAGIDVRAAHVVLTGFRFEHTRGTALTISAPGVQLRDSAFIDCGDPQRPQSQCIIATGNAGGVTIEGNSFVGSNAMTIKMRSSNEASAPQPKGGMIRYNLFADILKNSDNGQEPIQIAGPGGGEGTIALGTRVEHNIFLRANGDPEAISFKTPGNMARWNVFYRSNSAPHFRGAPDNILTGNLIFQSRPLRIAGKGNHITSNVIACPTHTVAMILTIGSPGYRGAEGSIISGNVILARDGLKYAAQESSDEAARPNSITENVFMSWQTNLAKALSLQSQEIVVRNRLKSKKNFICANH